MKIISAFLVAASLIALPAAADTSCLVGSWKSKVGDKNIYTFKKDKTGDRVHLDKAPVAFTWSLKDEKTVLVVFPEHGNTKRADFEFTVDCAAKVIKFQDMIPFAKQ
ncbi:MAG: hypothetical protein ACXWLR_11995 [Myxococcales bacterium]